MWQYQGYFEDCPKGRITFEAIEEYIKDNEQEVLECFSDWVAWSLGEFWQLAVWGLGKEEVVERLKKLRA